MRSLSILSIGIKRRRNNGVLSFYRPKLRDCIELGNEQLIQATTVYNYLMASTPRDLFRARLVSNYFSGEKTSEKNSSHLICKQSSAERCSCTKKQELKYENVPQRCLFAPRHSRDDKKSRVDYGKIETIRDFSFGCMACCMDDDEASANRNRFRSRRHQSDLRTKKVIAL